MTTTKTCGSESGVADGVAVGDAMAVAGSAVLIAWGALDVGGTAPTCPGVQAASTRISAATDRTRTFTFPRT
jgi:hypothetical protein